MSASRPEIPRGLFGFAPTDVIRVDVMKEDLGKYLEKKTTPLFQQSAGVVAAYFFLQFFPLFILGQYSARLARLENDRLIRASGGYLLLGGYVSGLLAVGIAVAAFLDRPIADIIVTRVLAAVLVLIAVPVLT